MNSPLRIETNGTTRVLTLDRPERRNALSAGLIADLTKALRAVDDEQDIRCVIITGAPPAFCAGLDLEEVTASLDENSAFDASPLFEMYETVESIGTPVLAAVNGAVMAGGAALICSCDLAVFGEDATFGYPGIRGGLVAPIIIPSLMRLVGTRRALQLLLTGETISANDALAAGVANEVVSRARLMDRAFAIAAGFADIPHEAVRGTKAAIRRVRMWGGPAPDEAARRFLGTVLRGGE